jgi:hypothetical protein
VDFVDTILLPQVEQSLDRKDVSPDDLYSFLQRLPETSDSQGACSLEAGSVPIAGLSRGFQSMVETHWRETGGAETRSWHELGSIFLPGHRLLWEFCAVFLKKISAIMQRKNETITGEEWQTVKPEDCMYPCDFAELDSQKPWPDAETKALKPGLWILYERWKEDKADLNQSHLLLLALLAGEAALVDRLLDRGVDVSEPGARSQVFLLDLFFGSGSPSFGAACPLGHQSAARTSGSLPALLGRTQTPNHVPDTHLHQ